MVDPIVKTVFLLRLGIMAQPGQTCLGLAMQPFLLHLHPNKPRPEFYSQSSYGTDHCCKIQSTSSGLLSVPVRFHSLSNKCLHTSKDRHSRSIIILSIARGPCRPCRLSARSRALTQNPHLSRRFLRHTYIAAPDPIGPVDSQLG